nr:hypothetical protein [Tanacetum cinerariifolium]
PRRGAGSAGHHQLASSDSPAYCPAVDTAAARPRSAVRQPWLPAQRRRSRGGPHCQPKPAHSRLAARCFCPHGSHAARQFCARPPAG